jgi:SnoaL-like domain
VDKLSELIARQEIQDVLGRYARAVDRRDWQSLRKCFHDGARDQHGEFDGDTDAFIDWVSKRHASVPFSMHFLGNCLIEFLSPEAAWVETYFIAMQRRDEAPPTIENYSGPVDMDVFGRYCDRFERRDGVWRIAFRQVAYDSTRTQPSSHHLRELVGVIGRRDQGDPVFLAKDRAAE